MTSLHYTAGNGHLEVARLLLERYAKIEARDSIGLTPISFRIDSGRLPDLPLLLDYNASAYPQPRRKDSTVSRSVSQSLRRRSIPTHT